jgi:hypothetical protein
MKEIKNVYVPKDFPNKLRKLAYDASVKSLNEKYLKNWFHPKSRMCALFQQIYIFRKM